MYISNTGQLTAAADAIQRKPLLRFRPVFCELKHTVLQHYPALDPPISDGPGQDSHYHEVEAVQGKSMGTHESRPFNPDSVLLIHLKLKI